MRLLVNFPPFLTSSVLPRKYPRGRETSRSVSEMKEWVCSKLDRPDGTVERDCARLYTGGTLFRVCYVNSVEGTTCLCSKELCNSSGRPDFAMASAVSATLIIFSRTFFNGVVWS